ncbi:hypothetical protein [Priestia taiwanensis]|uniref:Uncharacterized protein n=1 Tax=Priestia taiwanensis TaxID=1347902 RepID=A0A917AQL2_9BACI|nr:hypothetical protein [Priestia taiwanensis]MBM7363191.1 putative copper export protein [Priestia taiwanensis]GGE68378.1 hypothetical protein GCM10007140_18100 [Priestia taiwanensis]
MLWARYRNGIVFLLFFLMMTGVMMSISYIQEDIAANKLGLVLYIDVCFFVSYLTAACYVFFRKLMPIVLSSPSYTRKISSSMAIGTIIGVCGLVSLN